MVDDSMLIGRLPRIWIGFGIAVLFLITELFVGFRQQDLVSLAAVISLGGWFYWLYCVYKYHDVMGSIQGYNHPISPGRAIGMHWIPFYNLYWVFKWPSEIATFVNWRTQSPRAMNGIIPGLLVLVGVILLRVDGFVGFVVLFSAGSYISRRIRAACLAPPVPKSLHASAAAGPLGL
jgi:hypothetical protein